MSRFRDRTVLQTFIRRRVAMQRRLRPPLALALFAAVLARAAAGHAWREQSATQGDWQSTARLRMVDEQLKARGIRNSAVLDAMARVRRDLFVPPGVRRLAYEDTPLPIGHGQTISQPFIVAYMTEGTVKLTKAARGFPSKPRCWLPISRRRSPYPRRGTPAFAATGGEPTAADVGPLDRDSARHRARTRSVAREQPI